MKKFLLAFLIVLAACHSSTPAGAAGNKSSVKSFIPARPKAKEYIVLEARALVKKSARAYTALRSVELTYLAAEEVKLGTKRENWYFNETRMRFSKPARLHVQFMSGATSHLVVDGLGWEGKESGFYWPESQKLSAEQSRDFELRGDVAERWLQPLLLSQSPLRAFPVSQGGKFLQRVTAAPDKTINGQQCRAVRAERWIQDGWNGAWIYHDETAYFRDDGLLMAVRGFSLTPWGNFVNDFTVTSLQLNPQFDDSVWQFRLPPGQRDLVKNPPPRFWRRDLKIGTPVPNFSAPDVRDKPHRSADYKGKVLVLMFDLLALGGESLPTMSAVHTKWSGKGAQVLGVLLTVTPRLSRNPVYDPNWPVKKLPFPVIAQQDDFGNSLVRLFGLKRVPFTLVVGKDGRIAALNPQGAQLDAAIAKALIGAVKKPQRYIETPAEAATRKKFEQAAREIEFFDIGQFVRNRWRLSWKPADRARTNKSLQHLSTLVNAAHGENAVKRLLAHADPKVRTLALAALFQRENPQFLPAIEKLARDKTPTFSGHGKISKRWQATTGVGPPPEKQTVGDIARAMVNFYLECAGFNYGIEGSGNEPGFDEYWESRGQRAWCASWFAVQLARASRGTSPTQSQLHDDIRAVRARLDRLPATDRAWTLLYLRTVPGAEILASEAELIAAVRELGPDALMQMLARRIPSDDPDLQSRVSNNYSYESMVAWVLRHAREVLRLDQASELVEREKWERDYQRHGINNPMDWPQWAIAAAELQPQNAREILHTAWPRFRSDGQNRVTLAIKLWRLGGASEQDFLLSWFFVEKGDVMTIWPGAQGQFLESLKTAPDAPTRRLVAALLADGRIENYDIETLRPLAELLNTWLKREEFDIQRLWQKRGDTQGKLAVHQLLLRARQTQKFWLPAIGLASE